MTLSEFTIPDNAKKCNVFVNAVCLVDSAVVYERFPFYGTGHTFGRSAYVNNISHRKKSRESFDWRIADFCFASAIFGKRLHIITQGGSRCVYQAFRIGVVLIFLSRLRRHGDRYGRKEL